MIRFKNRNQSYVSMYGFTLIEVMLALALVAFVSVPLLFQQGSILRNVSQVSFQDERLTVASQFLYETVFKLTMEPQVSFTAEKKVDDPELTLTFSRGPIPEGSPLAKETYMVRDMVTMAWNENGTPRRDTLVTCSHVVPSPEKKGT